MKSYGNIFQEKLKNRRQYVVMFNLCFQSTLQNPFAFNVSLFADLRNSLSEIWIKSFLAYIIYNNLSQSDWFDLFILTHLWEGKKNKIILILLKLTQNSQYNHKAILFISASLSLLLLSLSSSKSTSSSTYHHYHNYRHLFHPRPSSLFIFHPLET